MGLKHQIERWRQRPYGNSYLVYTEGNVQVIKRDISKRFDNGFLKDMVSYYFNDVAMLRPFIT